MYKTRKTKSHYEFILYSIFYIHFPFSESLYTYFFLSIMNFLCTAEEKNYSPLLLRKTLLLLYYIH